jgi:hypothetical protein
VGGAGATAERGVGSAGEARGPNYSKSKSEPNLIAFPVAELSCVFLVGSKNPSTNSNSDHSIIFGDRWQSKTKNANRKIDYWVCYGPVCVDKK